MVIFCDLAKMELTLRAVESGDKEMLFGWRNLDEIVVLGSERKQVTWDEHSAWFDRILAGRNSLLLIVEASGLPVGQVRFDKLGSLGCSLSIYLIPEETGKGRGSTLIRAACKHAASIWRHIHWIEAIILRDNHRSIKAFNNAGFKYMSVDSKLKSEDHIILRYSPSARSNDDADT